MYLKNKTSIKLLRFCCTFDKTLNYEENLLFVFVYIVDHL